jgi:hypothetical protein
MVVSTRVGRRRRGQIVTFGPRVFAGAAVKFGDAFSGLDHALGPDKPDLAAPWTAASNGHGATQGKAQATPRQDETVGSARNLLIAAGAESARRWHAPEST